MTSRNHGSLQLQRGSVQLVSKQAHVDIVRFIMYIGCKPASSTVAVHFAQELPEIPFEAVYNLYIEST